MGGVANYLFSFLTNQDFQAQQPWVRSITKFCAHLSHHGWTSSRFFGGVTTIIVEAYGYPHLALVIFVGFALTDWIDGKVARYRNAHSGKFGAWLDGTADKFIVLPIIFWWGKEFVPTFLIYLQCTIELGGNVFIYLFNQKKLVAKVNAVIDFIFPGKKLPDPVIKSDIFEHILVGKIKFSLQVVVIIIIWIARIINPSWEWWPLWMTLITSIITLLAFFSVACKVNPVFIRYLADFVTLGNTLCGAVSIYLAIAKPKMAAALIIIAAVFDIADGYVARKTKETDSQWGAYFDDIGDFVSFGVAPAWLFFQFGVPWYFAISYVLATALRLYYFTKKKAVAEGVFYGVPSTAVAIFLSSIVLWNKIPISVLSYFMAAGAVLEILFFIQWYHFRNFPRLPALVQGAYLAVFFFSVGFESFGEGTAILFGLYLVTFSRKLAERAWKWG